jgi:hypothetical protein
MVKNVNNDELQNSLKLIPPLEIFERNVSRKTLLPNMEKIEEVETLINMGAIYPVNPMSVRLPLPGRYTNREGARLGREELYPLIDLWLSKSQGGQRFIIQGGNRYISSYLSNKAIDFEELKVMSIDKAPLYKQLVTLLSDDEKEVIIHIPHQTDKSAAILGTRRNLLKSFAGQLLMSPFTSPTKDEKLDVELAEAVLMINEGIKICNLGILQNILKGTKLAGAFDGNTCELHFIDDLFYRGRTLYSLAIIIKCFGGNPQKMRLSTICCDCRSRELQTPFHNVLNKDKLYPFENSVRSEQGYWQDTGEEYVFTDLGLYWEYLNLHVDKSESEKVYSDWQKALADWYAPHAMPDEDLSLSEPLIWLEVFNRVFGVDANIEKIIDQKGYKIGACVPFARILDRFISQEETVEARYAFKQRIISLLQQIQIAIKEDIKGFDKLANHYRISITLIDFEGLKFMIEDDSDYIINNYSMKDIVLRYKIVDNTNWSQPKTKSRRSP